MGADYTVSLQNLKGGAVVERFDDELRRIVENICDPNTDAKATRQITLKVTIKPAPDREMCAVTIGCESKLAPSTSLGTSIFVGTQAGEFVATEYDPKQPSLAGLDGALDSLKNSSTRGPA